MFEHLPVITDESWDVLVDKEIPVFEERFHCYAESLSDMRKVTEYVCQEMRDYNPNLVKAILTCSHAVAGTLESDGVDPYIARLAGMLCLSNILPLLRLVDRSLEAQELEQKFMR
jgi:hypothetical protein